MPDMLRLLTFSTLYPNAAQPHHGIFVENRLRHLLGSGEATSTVLAPVPYYPKGGVARAIGARFGWARASDAPAHEIRHGISVHHPRYLAIPKIGMNVAPDLLARSAAQALRRLIDDGHRFDAIDAHYAYPDGVAAIALGRAFNLPVVITARGSDITLLPEYKIPRRRIVDALAAAQALIGVSAALAEGMVALGADPQRVHVLRNGIDLAMFRPVDRAQARAALDLPPPGAGNVLISVGHLIARKRVHLTIQALTALPGVILLLVGDGPERAALQGLAEGLGMAQRVRFLGTRAHDRLAACYGAADAMVLASSREGWANVLLESMACGTPVVASNIAGNTDVVQSPEAGLIVAENTALGFASAITRLFAARPDRGATRAYAERFSWDETTAGQLAVFRAVLGRSRES